MLMEERRGAAFLWCVQGDAAAGVEVEGEDLAAVAELER